ncbi:MAG TPA: acyl carrier protein [Vicinamibacterales bacterium]|nr:acyl carrier protein [Vicinamibacterales bacterium]
MSVDPRLQTIFEAVFGPNGAPLSEQDSPETIKGWDSLGHLSLILALEAEFGVQFDSADIANLVTVSAIQQRLSQDSEQMRCA